MPSLGGWRLAALGQAGKKPKISPASWAWAARGSSHPGPPRVSEGVRVCRSSVPSPGHRGQSRAPGARPRRGAAPGCSLVSRGGGGPPVLQGLARGRGNPGPSPPHLRPTSSFAPPFPCPDLQALAVWQGQLGVPGPAKRRGLGASPTRGPRPGRATFRGPGGGARHLALTRDTLCQPPFRP